MLRVVTAHRPPLAFVSDGASNGSEPLVRGYLIDLLPTLLQQANVLSAYEIYSLKVCYSCYVWCMPFSSPCCCMVNPLNPSAVLFFR